jgi:hypothetical protein
MFSLLIWILASGEGVLSFLPYLQTRFAVSGGYTEAMMQDFSSPTYFQVFILALLYLTILGSVAFYFLFTKQISWITAWLLPLISLFLAFKSSFVRADLHAYIFLGYVFLSALYYYCLIEFNTFSKMDLAWKQGLVKNFVPLLAIIVFSSFSFLGGRFDVKNEFLETQKLIEGGPGARSHNRELSRKALRETYHLNPEFLAEIDPRKTTDIIPWDIALLYGYDLTWMPRPVLQSYAAYTSELDSLDAVFFDKSNSPEQLIVSLTAIDQRYILFDTPATFRTLLGNYEYVSQSSDGHFALFRKKQGFASKDLILIDQNEYSFSETILIPNEPYSHVFLFAEVEPSILGKLLNVVYKPTDLFIEITLQNGELRKHRLISDLGKNGLFVSKYTERLNHLQAVFTESYVQNITSVRFLGNGVIYKEPIKVRLYKIPFQ